MTTQTVEHKLHYVICNKCGRPGAKAWSADAARNWATEHGWHIGATWLGEPADLCEECDIEVEEEGEQ